MVRNVAQSSNGLLYQESILGKSLHNGYNNFHSVQLNHLGSNLAAWKVPFKMSSKAFENIDKAS
jgi:hypothetical protein